MKVIDLLNKIANGEAPKKIKFESVIYEFEENQKDYINEEREYLFFDCYSHRLGYILNDEVKIIEEDKEIEEIELIEELSMRWKDNDIIINGKVMSEDIDEVFVEKINEVIRAVNELKKGK